MGIDTKDDTQNQTLEPDSVAAQRGLAQLRAVVESMAEGLVLSDAAGNLLEWNRAALEMHGYRSLDEVLNHLDTFPAVIELSTPDGRVLPLDEWPMSRVLRGESFVSIEVHVRRLDIEMSRIISYGGSPVRGPDGRVTLAVLTLHDVTEERRAQALIRQSEERLRAIFDQSTAGIAQLDLNGRFILVNQWFCDLLGYTQDELRQFRMQDLTHPEDVNRNLTLLDQAKAEGGDYYIEKRYLRRDGTTVWVHVNASLLRDDAGRPQAVLGVVTDLTERKRAEQERVELLDREQAARAEAERMGRMKDEFLATLSHELRTPLNAILGWSQIIRRGDGVSDDVAQGLEVIERNARAQAQIIEDLLDMSRIIGGKVRLDVGRIDLATIVQASVDTARPTAEAKAVHLVCATDPLHDVVVSGDANRLQQVLWNLLTNAIKFTPTGGQVRVLLERVRSQVRISVIDTGEGIGAEFLPRVFDRFRQADASTTRRHGGLGLGLSIVKQLVELHGGSVHASSDGPGTGSTFAVSLPITVIRSEPGRKSHSRHPCAAPASTHAGDGPADIRGVRVLVVDDEADARGLVCRLLQDCEAVVTTAGSVAEALTRFDEARFDVLVSDIGMPGADGYALIRQVRALGPAKSGDVPAIALTAYARAEDRAKAISAGFQMHLAKPVEPVKLVTMVASAAAKIGIARGTVQ